MIRNDRRGKKLTEPVPDEDPASPGFVFSAKESQVKPPGQPTPGQPKRRWIYTQNPAFQNILNRIPLYARTELPVLITGEPGTGKELVADALWVSSFRRQQPFLKINCAAISESVANSELFGHVPGAFTGAHRRKRGKFELAHKGTLFLDEIGELPLSLQSRLLRAVEQGDIEPVGSEKPIWVNVRLFAATNQDLRLLISRGEFRRDLYDRLAILLIHLPPLRERPGDILLLANHFAWTAAKKYGKAMVRFAVAVEKAMLNYHWPGNVRELKNVVTRAVLLSQGSIVKELDLDPEPPRLNYPGEDVASRPLITSLTSRPARRDLEELLKAARGNVSALSRQLRVCTKTIYRWLQHYDLEIERFRP